MSGEGERRWKLGGRVTDGDRHGMSFARELTEAVVDELKAKFRSVDDLADQVGFARVLESGNRWGQILDKAEAELAGERLISNQAQVAAGLELRTFVRLHERLLEKLNRGESPGPDAVSLLEEVLVSIAARV